LTISQLDDGSGKLQIWRIEKFEKTPVPQDLYGQFYAGDSYIILYTYKQGTKEYIIYFWLGRNSSQDEKGAAALHAKNLDDELHGAATQVPALTWCGVFTTLFLISFLYVKFRY
jgi:hypothetical protein